MPTLPGPAPPGRHVRETHQGVVYTPQVKERTTTRLIALLWLSFDRLREARRVARELGVLGGSQEVGAMRSADDKIKKLRALMNDQAATPSERAAARDRIATIKNPGRGMGDAELAATIARLKDERAAIPIPHDVERRRKEKREEIERYEHERRSVGRVA